MGLSPHLLCQKRSYPARHCSLCPPLFPVLQKGACNSMLATSQVLNIVLLSKRVGVKSACTLIQPIFRESAPRKVASLQPLKQVSRKRSSFFKVVMVKHAQPVNTWISQIKLAYSRPFKPLIFKNPVTVLKPHSPHCRLGKPSNGQKKLPWTRMGTLIKASSLWVLWFGGEGGRRKEAGLRWQDIALSDQTGSPHAVWDHHLRSECVPITLSLI